MLTMSFYDINQKILTKKDNFQTFSWFQFYVDKSQVMHDYVHWHCSIDYCVKLSLVNKTYGKTALFHPEMISA